MKQEEKQLLLQDLCTRLPYGIIVDYKENEFEFPHWRITTIYPETMDGWIGYYKRVGAGSESGSRHFNIGDVKPYLRPMLSMTKEEKNELTEMTITSPNLETAAVLFRERHYEEEPHWRNDWAICSLPKVLNWLNAHHFDYRNLIEKGLAIAVTKENNPYKE